MIKTLLVEQNAGDAARIHRSLARHDPTGFEVIHVSRSAEVAQALDGRRYDVLLIGLPMDERGDLTPTAPVISAAVGIPVLLLAEADDERLHSKAIRLGIQDFLPKRGIDGEILARCIRHAIGRQRLWDKLRQAHEHERFRATHDAVSGLPNRFVLEDRLQAAVAYAERYGQSLAVLFVDVDCFKLFNDRFGHISGDEVLAAVARRLTCCVRKSDTVARFGGDEFVVILSRIDSASAPDVAAKRILACMSAPFQVDGREVRVSVSIGNALYPRDAKDADGLLRHADAQMYRARRSKGRSRGPLARA